MMGEEAVYSVSQINQRIKDLLDADVALSGLFVRGEVSNYKMYPSGHHYFSLKDEGGAIRCVMFRREAAMLRFRPENGMKVVAFGRVTVFPRDGQYQFYVSQITPDGVGDLHVAFEQLKSKLQKEGLFDPAHKRPLPRFPKRIALVTSPAGAAVRDMLRILKARWPMSKTIVVPVRVQGTEAPDEIAEAIAWVNTCRCADLIITGRGGGSMEDLWAFNAEQVVRAVYKSKIPVISAVGHEPDITITDYVADLRAATPSNAAELAVPDQSEIYAHIHQASARISQAMLRKLREARQSLSGVERNRILQSPIHYIQDRRVLLDYQRSRLAHGFSEGLGKERERFAHFAASLDALSPLKVLGRGYAIPRNRSGQLVKSIEDVQSGETMFVRVVDGEIPCTVLEPR